MAAMLRRIAGNMTLRLPPLRRLVDQRDAALRELREFRNRMVQGPEGAAASGSGAWRKGRPDTTGILIAFRIQGGIGDHLLAARYVRDLLAAVGDFRFDIYSSRLEAAAWIFGTFLQFNRCYDEYFSWNALQFYRYYPLAMIISQFVVFQHEDADWVELHREHPKLVRVCEAIERFRHAQDLNEIIAVHPRLDGLLGSKAVFMNLDRHSFAHAMSGIAYGGHRLRLNLDPGLSERAGLNNRPYVTIHNGFDAEFLTTHGYAARSTKVYPHFDAVVALLRRQLPDLHIVQLGAATSRPIEGVDLQLIGRSSLRETAAILAGSSLHIDNESGLVHLAACVGTRSCVLFGPTPPAYFGYEENLNMAPRLCGGCWWATKDWTTNCPRGLDRPVCLHETPPDAVAGTILAALERQTIGMSRMPPPMSDLGRLRAPSEGEAG
jgi:hypothetical protein